LFNYNWNPVPQQGVRATKHSPAVHRPQHAPFHLKVLAFRPTFRERPRQTHRSAASALAAQARACNDAAGAATLGEKSTLPAFVDGMSGIYSDLAGHLRGYEGHAQIATLSFLLEKCRCPPDAEVHVLRMLEQCCKDQKHTILYAKLSHEYSGNAALSELFDKKWSMDRDTENRKEQANLETQLTEKRNQALKEEVAPNVHDFFSFRHLAHPIFIQERLCLVRLTQFHHTKGDIESALRTCGEWFSKCQVLVVCIFD